MTTMTRETHAVKYMVHLLHSAVKVAGQTVIFSERSSLLLSSGQHWGLWSLPLVTQDAGGLEVYNKKITSTARIKNISN
jgi:hypothetical protein